LCLTIFVSIHQDHSGKSKLLVLARQCCCISI